MVFMGIFVFLRGISIIKVICGGSFVFVVCLSLPKGIFFAMC